MMSSSEVSRKDLPGMSYAGHLEVPGVFHLVELPARGGQAGPGEFHSRLLALATLHGSIFKHGIQLWAYSILSDRILLVLVPLRPRVIGPALDEVNHRALPFWNRRYFACPFADEVAWRVLRYVDRASVPAGGDALDPQAPNSAAEHAGLLARGLLTAPPERLPDPVAWRGFVGAPESEQFGQALELCLRTGKPFGPPSFIRNVEEACGRHVRSSCLGWQQLIDGCRIPSQCRVLPPYVRSASVMTQCGSGV
jgi:hypothetical protein